ncbi:hypothetical protein CASFOL_034553 [Castilleja foliolosa]|uniref:Homing endonuclease LAGLIDADG domain-containing protein n=1 Tax=Castilleja foliolosa TaxID=1961234 RepID=A0ABD3BQ65_9LAMI
MDVGGLGDETRNGRVQLPEIDLKDRMYEIFGLLSERDTIYKSAAYNGSSLMPVGWLEYKEVLLYRFFCLHLGKKLNICIPWNIRLKEFELVELDSELYGFFVHRNSLLWLDGC